jgi:hypothetical protein
MASPTGNASVRPLRLKVLYTFDAENRNNCLARWPHVLELQTAFTDDLTQIGVVDLKTCLDALATSSPELLSQDALDYTVYAFDYSEEGTPLSGQGLLSTIFDPNAQNPTADIASRVVTGRVTKNVLGLFSGNGQETLEVKLRLLPVAKQAHRRSFMGQPSQHDNHQFAEASGWSNAPSVDHEAMLTRNATESRSPIDRSGIEHMQRMLHEGSSPRELSANRLSESLPNASNSRPGSRAGTPGQTQSFNPPARPSFSQASRPSSRASFRNTAQPASNKRRESFNSGYYSGDEVQTEEGPPKKRAKTTQIGAPSRSDLNIERQPESLRMAASTASSVRVHRPVALNPALTNLHSSNFAEEPVRPPTPIPSKKKPGSRRQQNQASGLRRGSQQHLQAEVAYAGHPAPDTAEVSATSPVFNMGPSVASTPANIPSSPPVITNYASISTSPVLPIAPRAEQNDSGFIDEFDDIMTGQKNGQFNQDILDDGHIDFQFQPTAEESALTETHNHFMPAYEEGNIFDDEGTNGFLPPPPTRHTNQSALSKQPLLPAYEESNLFDDEGTNGFLSPPPTRQTNQSAPSKQPSSQAQNTRPAIRAGMSSPKLAPAPYPRARQLEEEMGRQPSLPPVAASDPAGRQLQRSNTWAGDMSDLPMSDAPAGDGGRAKSVSKKKVGREQTKARLENALAQNEMPPYCDNCGTIDTPAWRRVFARALPGHLYESVELLPETQGAYVWKKVDERAEDGTVLRFSAYKLSKSSDDKGDEWTNVTLCNREYQGIFV